MAEGEQSKLSGTKIGARDADQLAWIDGLEQLLRATESSQLRIYEVSGDERLSRLGYSAGNESSDGESADGAAKEARLEDVHES